MQRLVLGLSFLLATAVGALAQTSLFYTGTFASGDLAGQAVTVQLDFTGSGESATLTDFTASGDFSAYDLVDGTSFPRSEADAGAPIFSTSFSSTGEPTSLNVFYSYLDQFDGTVDFEVTAPSITGNAFDFSVAQGGNLSTAALTASAVPEPATSAALAGILALGAVAWRRRRGAAA